VWQTVQRQGVEPEPPPLPDVKPSAVAKEIRDALAESPRGTAQSYAAFYDQCAAVLDVDSSVPIARLRTRMEKAKALLQLSSPEAFKDIVSRELKEFESGTIDREKYAAAFRSLSVNCRGAEK
jgi:hypothetical protein